MNDMIIVFIGVIGFIVGICLIAAVFTISNQSQKQTLIMQSNIVLIEELKNIMHAQLEILGSLAEKNGVPVEDINDVTEKFGFTFNEATNG